MKTRYYLLSLAAVALLASCAKEMPAPVDNPGEAQIKTYLTVGIAPETKTHMEDNAGTSHKVFWSNGDKIAVNGTASDALAGLADDVQSTTFSFSGVLSTPYNVVYPASIYTDATHVTLPEVQTYKDGGFADGMFPMAGYSADGSSITISHLCAVLKISVKRATSGTVDEDNIVAVRFKGRNNEKVNGSFEIDYTAPALTAATGTGSETEVRVVKSQATSSTAIDYYLVVPAREYASGFDIIVQDASGHIMTKSAGTSGGKTLAAGKLYTLPAFEFVPTDTEVGVVIATASDLVNFAIAFNNKEYGEDVVATVTDDLVFDANTSADFNATNGIGTEYGGDNYFNGVLNGDNHTISGLVATVPLFGGIENGTVKDLTLDNTCSFSFTHPITEAGYFGAIAGYHKGIMSNVTVNSNVSIEGASDVEGDTALGGLVGRLASIGTIDGCTFAGHLSTPSSFITKSYEVNVYIGGIAGYSQSSTTVVKNSHLHGTIDCAANIAAPAANNTTPFLFVGGIIGKSNGLVDNCDTACLDDAGDGAISITASDSNIYYATIINHSTQAHCLAEGGIVGYNYGGGVVSSCTNNAKFFTNIVASGTNAEIDLKARYFRIGGIVGINTGSSSTVSGSTNNGVIVNSSTARLQSTGGVVGWNSGTVSACSNNASATISHIAVGSYLSTAGDIDVRNPIVGGVIGENSSSNVSDLHNYADLDISVIELDVTNYGVCLGGVIGKTSKAIDGGASTKSITNSGKVYASFGVAGASTNGIDIGGIVGQSSASVENSVNKGYVCFYGISGTTVMKYIHIGGIVGRINTNPSSITGCINKSEGGSNEGEVYFYFDNNATKHSENYSGGILGYSDSGVSISGCSNSGYIHGGNGSTNKGSASCFVGGIVAYLSGSGSGITNCINNGNINNHQRNNTFTSKANSTYTGGIAGEIIGTNDERISISNCTDSPTNYVVSHRGFVGGVVGYAEYADLSSCSHDKGFTDTSISTSYFVGGIAGWALNCTLTSCTWSGSIINTSQLQANGGGGIVAQMDGGTLDGCISQVTDIQKTNAATNGGALVGIALNSPTIKNCHYKATVNGSAANIVGTGSFNNGGGNVAEP